MDFPTNPRTRRPIAWLGGGALLLGAYLTTQLYVWVNLWPVSIGWSEAALVAVPMVAVWMAAVPLVHALGRRFPIEGFSDAWRIVLHLALSFAVSGAALGLLDLSDRWLHWTTFIGAPGWIVTNVEIAIVHLHLGVGIYWVVLAAQHALRWHGRSLDRELEASRLEAELAQAQLLALRMQLDPHFLFNTLNSVGVLLRRSPDDAERMLHRLADLLHATLELGERTELPLREELAVLDHYLRIEEVRFSDRLVVSRDVSDEALDALVPSLVLQPLVENALRHGIAPRRRGGRVEVRARVRDGRLHLEVSDDGAGLSPDRPLRWGVGLTNTRLRLERAFGDRASMEVAPRPGGGTTVALETPFRREEGDDEGIEAGPPAPSGRRALPAAAAERGGGDGRTAEAAGPHPAPGAAR